MESVSVAWMASLVAQRLSGSLVLIVTSAALASACVKDGTASLAAPPNRPSASAALAARLKPWVSERSCLAMNLL